MTTSVLSLNKINPNYLYLFSRPSFTMKMTKRVKKEPAPYISPPSSTDEVIDDNDYDQDKNDNTVTATTTSQQQQEVPENIAPAASSSSTATTTTTDETTTQSTTNQSKPNNKPSSCTNGNNNRKPTKSIATHSSTAATFNHLDSSNTMMVARASSTASTASSSATSATNLTTVNTTSAADPTMALRENLMRELKKGEHECLICSNGVKAAHGIWSCATCYKSYHLFCIKTWCKKSNENNYPNNNNNNDDDSYFARQAAATAQFRCPSCNTTTTVPQNYKCFCGKQTDPKLDPYITPHSCGEVCGKLRGNGCPHKCALMCHPGPCSQCTAPPLENICPCGKSTYTHPCGTPDPKKTCDNVCDKILNCGFHNCEQQCHQGPCKPCDVKVKMTCHCGKITKDVPCGTNVFSCEKLCNKTQRCGNCKCDYVCHTGNCPPCQTDPAVVTSCPCGKTPLSQEVIKSRKSCQDPIPTCENRCSKVLPCGMHDCDELCHEGVCPKCTIKRVASCPCGYNSKKVRCFEAKELTCQKTCGAQMTCGRHTCQEICCPHRRNPDSNSVEAHRCKEICGRQLMCGHFCEDICHKGSCNACPNYILEDLRCSCGSQFLAAPLPCGTKLPPCHQPCPRQRTCGHNDRKHTCHFGDCPPCPEPVDKKCPSHGTILRVQCSADPDALSCGKICGKPLPYCGHPCPRSCHSGDCTKNATKKFCQVKCGRMLDCGHRCNAKCHINHGATTEEGALKKECPPCNNDVEVPCSCGIQIVKFSCRDFMKWKETNPDRKTAPCDDDCSRKRREAALRPAASADPNSDLFSNPIVFSCKLWSAAKELPDFFCHIEKQLAEAIKNKDGFKKLNPMNRERRSWVHELAWQYHISTESVDSEPNRAVLVTRTPASKAPNPLLSDAIYTNDKKGHNPFVLIEEVLSSPRSAKQSIIVFEGERLNDSDLHLVLRPFVGKVVLVNGIDQIRTVPNLASDASTKFFRGEINVVLAVFNSPNTCTAAFSHLRKTMCKFLFHMFGEDAPPRNVEDSMGRLRLVQTNAAAFTDLNREIDNLWDQKTTSAAEASSKKASSSSTKKKDGKSKGKNDDLNWFDDALAKADGGKKRSKKSKKSKNDDDDSDDADENNNNNQDDDDNPPVVKSVWNSANPTSSSASTASPTVVGASPHQQVSAPGVWANMLKKS